MATRVDKTTGLSTLNESNLLRRLRLQSSRKEGEANFIGLKRSEALGDVSDPSQTLDNILEKISLLDSSERNQYGGPYDGVDWSVTGDFVDEEIDKQFLLPLAGSSIGGGSLGSQVSTTPRIRIEDRIGIANSFVGEGSYPGLHSGPDARFYRTPQPVDLGYIKFSFSGGVVTAIELKRADKTTNLLVSEILGNLSSLVIDLSGYEVDGELISLSGSNVSLRLLATGSVWEIEEGLGALTSIRSILGTTQFNDTYFVLTRPYSFLNLPEWYVGNPGSAEPDNIDPATSAMVIRSEGGVVSPLFARGYWYSRNYVEGRWTSTEQSLIGNNSVTEDSNMRWFNNPSPLRGEQYNWGIRWDGYLRIGPGIYGLQVQTNVDIKIDIAVDGTNPYWVNVFDTRGNSAQESEDTYISRATFDTDSVDSRFKYVTGAGANDWIGYVPITIRMFRGGPDKTDSGISIPTEPNLFVKTTTVPSALSFYAEDHIVTLSGTDGAWDVSGLTLNSVIGILEDADASVNYELVSQGDSVFVTPVPIALTTDGTTVSSDTTGLTADTYTLRVSPNRAGAFTNNLTALWKGRIASPGPGQTTYADLVDSTYNPDPQKLSFDARPDWWKITEGHPFDRGAVLSDQNTPLDGMVASGFRSTLRSDAPGVGLYGNGADPVVYSSRPNIILGEARYGAGDDLGSNYAGLLLEANDLGEGGKLIVNGLPIDNATFSGANRLGANDLGGDPNHKTEAFDNITPRVSQLYLWNPVSPDGNENKYYLNSDLTAISESDDPTVIGLPPFAAPDWLSPITVTATEVADDSAFTTNAVGFVSPLTLSVEKVTVDVGGTDYDLLAFSTTLASILISGSEVSSFSGKYVKFYNETDLAFQYSLVDTGAGLSFSDVLKLTYDPNFNAALSEIPKPPSDRVTPFGFDLPEYGGGLCYPPYAINNPLLGDIAISDTDLYDSKPAGNYDVFWGDHTKGDLGGYSLTITERLEFNSTDIASVVSTLTSSEILDTALNSSDYSHRLRIDVALDPSLYDPDQVEHIGNGEKVKDSYYAYVQLD
jgi:hypothetical protein